MSLLKLHRMWSLSLLEGESGSKVGAKKGCLLYEWNQLIVHRHLGILFSSTQAFLSDSCAKKLDDLEEAALLKNSSFTLSSTWTPLMINLCRCGNDICLVHALEGHAIELVGTGDEEQSGWKLLQENDSTATESARQEDEHRPWSDARPQFCSL